MTNNPNFLKEIEFFFTGVLFLRVFGLEPIFKKCVVL